MMNMEEFWAVLIVLGIAMMISWFVVAGIDAVVEAASVTTKSLEMTP